MYSFLCIFIVHLFIIFHSIYLLYIFIVTDHRDWCFCFISHSFLSLWLAWQQSESSPSLQYQLRVTLFDSGHQHFFGRTWKSGSHSVSGSPGQSCRVLFNEVQWLISHWLMIFSVISWCSTWLRVLFIQKLPNLQALFHVERLNSSKWQLEWTHELQNYSSCASGSKAVPDMIPCLIVVDETALLSCFFSQYQFCFCRENIFREKDQ